MQYYIFTGVASIIFLAGASFGIVLSIHMYEAAERKERKLRAAIRQHREALYAAERALLVLKGGDE